MADLHYITPAQARAARRRAARRQAQLLLHRSGARASSSNTSSSELIKRYGARRCAGRPEGPHDDRPRTCSSEARKAIAEGLNEPGDPLVGDRHDRPANGYIERDGRVRGATSSRSTTSPPQGHRQPGSTFKAMALVAALPRGIDPATTTHIVRPLKLRGPQVRHRSTSRRYGGTATSGTIEPRAGDAHTPTTPSTRSSRSTSGPTNVTKTAHKMGVTSPAARLPGRGARRPEARRLAAGDGQRLRDDRRRRLAQHARWRSPRSSSPTASVDDLGKPQRVKVFTRRRHGRGDEDPRAEHRERHRHARRRSAAPPAARPARPTTTSTPGSTASRRTRRPPCGWATRHKRVR